MRHRNHRLAIVAAFGLTLIGIAVLAFELSDHGTPNSVGEVAAEVDSPTSEASAPATALDVTEQVVEASDDASSAREIPPSSEPARASDAWLLVTAISRVDGVPLSGVRVSAHNGGGALEKLAEATPTDRNGRAEFAVPSGTELVVFADEYRPNASVRVVDVSPLKPGERRDLELDIDPGGTLHALVRVVRCADGTPISGAIVQVSGAAVPSEGVTDATGGFEFDYPPLESTDMHVLAADFAPQSASLQGLWLNPGAPQVICLDAPAGLTAEVVQSTGEPAVGVRVRVEWSQTIDAEGFLSENPTWEFSELGREALTDANGRAQFVDLPANVPLRASIAADKEPSAPEARSMTLKPRETRELRWKLGAGCRIDGRVLDQEGHPVADVVVDLRRADADEDEFLSRATQFAMGAAKATTDQDGRFTFEQVASGSWWLAPISGRRGANTAPDEVGIPMAVQIDEETRQRDVVLIVQRGLFIEGRVLDPDGRPVDAAVTAREESNRCYAGSRTDAGGAFHVGPLLSGFYELTARRYDHAVSAAVRAAAGQSEVELRLRVGGSIAGRVISAEPSRLRFADVTIGQHEGEQHHVAADEKTGAFSIGGLSPGAYDLFAFTADGLVGEVRGVVVNGKSETRDVVVPLERGGRVRVRCSSCDDRATIEIVCDGNMLQSDALEPGGNGPYTVPARRITVRLIERSGSAPRIQTVEVIPGQLRSIVFD